MCMCACLRVCVCVYLRACVKCVIFPCLSCMFRSKCNMCVFVCVSVHSSTWYGCGIACIHFKSLTSYIFVVVYDVVLVRYPATCLGQT